MANLLASPTVSPSKSLPLSRENVKRQFKLAALLRLTSATVSRTDSSRHKLSGVVLRPLQKIGLPPREETVQSSLRVKINVDVVLVRPNLQAHQHDSDVYRSIQLQPEEENVFSEWVHRGSCRLKALMARRQADCIQNMSFNRKTFYLVNVIYNSKNTVFSIHSISLILGEEKRQMWSDCFSTLAVVKGLKVDIYLRVVHHHKQLHKLLWAISGFRFLKRRRKQK